MSLGWDCIWSLVGARAAFNGHLECLKYAHENGCPWDKEDFVDLLPLMVILFECLKYAHENGCP